MVSFDDAVGMIISLPEVTEGARYGRRAWFVAGKQFAWERPLTKADVRRLGDLPAPGGPILGLSIEDLAAKESALQAGHRGVFTISHFDGYPSILVQLDEVEVDVLHEAVVDAWLSVAPEKIARAHAERLNHERS